MKVKRQKTIEKMYNVKVALYIVGLGCIFLIYIVCFCVKGNNLWDVDDVYGNWKVARVIYAAKSGYGSLELGNEIGRSFCISEQTITDSKPRDAEMKKLKVPYYDMHILRCEKSEYDVTESEILAEFNWRNNIILSKAGITDTLIPEFVFYAETNKTEDNDSYVSLLRLFPYQSDNKDMLVMELPYGSYVLERNSVQKKTCNLWGKWRVEELVSRGTGENVGIDFTEEYGSIYQIAKNRLRLQDEEWEISVTKESVDRRNYEQTNGIKEGLGIDNKKIIIINVKMSNGCSIEIIPINGDEIIAQIGNQWFRLRRLKEYREPSFAEEEVLTGIWKPVLLLEEEKVDPKSEALTYDNLFWWYGNWVMLEADAYSVEVSDWKTEKILAGDFKDKYDVPVNVMGMFDESDILHVAAREVDHVEEIYIILERDRMIRGRNGLWFELKKI